MLSLIRVEVDKKYECFVMFGCFYCSDFVSWGGKKKNFFVFFIVIFQLKKKKQVEFVIQIFKNYLIFVVVQCLDICCNDDSDCFEFYCCVKLFRGK